VGVATRRRSRAEAVNGGRFDFSAAKIYADAKSGCHPLYTPLG
jgi:hypothetical protein